MKREQRARLLADAYARHPERFPNGCPVPRPLPTAVWINPPKASALVEQPENTMTLESDPPAIEAVRATLEVDPARASLVTLDLILEDRCMATAQ